MRNALVKATLAGAIAVLPAACGSGPAAQATSKKYQQALAFVQCMRGHGEPSFPDPASDGTVTDSQAKPGSPQLREAVNACRSMLSGVVFKLSAAQQQAQLLSALKEAACVRAHGIATFPDPSLRNGSLDLSLKGTGIDPASPLFLAAARACHLPLRIGGPGPRGGGP
jgi:hypothetical protein